MHQFDPDAIEPRSHPKYARWRYVAPLPSVELMGIVGAASIEQFLVVGDAWAQVISKFIGGSDTVLDVGCGCGRVARFLLSVPGLRYVGFDIVRPSIEWCRENLTGLSGGRFEFHHVDGYSAHYNPRGLVQPRAISFPCGDRSVDLAFGASLFTHLLEDDACVYLRETRRVLRPGGRALFSILPTDVRESPFVGAEDRIMIAPDYFVQMAAQAGLSAEERLGELAGQEALLFRADALHPHRMDGESESRTRAVR